MVRSMLALLLAAAPAWSQDGAAQWSDPAGLPRPLANGGVMVATGADTVIAAPGGGPDLYAYSPSTGTWSAALAPAPRPFDFYTRMAPQAGSGRVYVLFPDLHFARYDVAGNTWTSLPSPASWSAYGEDVQMAVTTSGVYVYGLDTLRMKIFTPDAGAGGEWTEVVVGVPSTGGPLLKSMTWPGGGDALYGIDRIYASGSTKNGLWTYSIPGNAWTRLGHLPANTASPSSFTVTGCLVGGPAGSLFALLGTSGGSQALYRYTIAGNSWVQMEAVPGRVHRNGVIAWPDGGDSIFVAGAVHRTDGPYVAWGSVDFWTYSISGDRFLPPTLAGMPVNPGQHSALVSAGNRLYALGSESVSSVETARFQSCSPGSNSWEPLAHPPFLCAVGTSLAYDGKGYIYATGVVPGAPPGPALVPTFHRYRIGNNTWEELPASPIPPSWGAHLAGAGPDRIFLVPGALSNGFLRFSPPDELGNPGVWTSPTQTPGAACAEGAALAYPGFGDRLYLLTGAELLPGSSRETAGNGRFYSYSISLNAWTLLAAPPEVCDRHSSLCYPGFGPELYAFLGRGNPTLWSYSLAGDVWTPRPRAPGSPYSSQSLAGTVDGDPVLYALDGKGFSPGLWRYRVRTGNTAPGIDNLLQLHPVDLSPIALGGTAPGGAFIASASASDEEGDPVRLDIEIRTVGTLFSGDDENIVRGLVAHLEERGTAALAGLEAGAGFHWRGRLSDSLGASSAWMSFGSNPEDPAEVDISTAPPAAVSDSGGRKACGQSAPAGPAAAAFLLLLCAGPGAALRNSAARLKRQALCR